MRTPTSEAQMTSRSPNNDKPSRPDKSPNNDQRGRSTNPDASRSYRIIQKPANPGSISDKEARDAARWVKQNRPSNSDR
jgi:hypothetical protein